MKKIFVALIACLPFVVACESQIAKSDKQSGKVNSQTGQASTDADQAAHQKPNAAEQETKTADSPVKKKLDELKATFQKESVAIRETLEGAGQEDRAKLMKLYSAYQATIQDLGKQAIELAKEHSDDPLAIDALIIAATQGNQSEAEDILVDEYLESEKLASVCNQLANLRNSAKSQKRLEKLINKSPHDSVKAAATLALANMLQQIDQSGKNRDQYVELLNKVVKDYPNVVVNGRNVAATANVTLENIRALEKLSVGNEAPEISGEDLDGVAFNLTDYRGKVVMLDFWGDW